MSRSNTWTWRSLGADGVETASKGEFETLVDCIVDAKEHGYVVVSARDERRRKDSPQALE